MSQYVIVTETATGKVLWEAPTTGQPLIEYVPAQAFRLKDAGEARIEFKEKP